MKNKKHNFFRIYNFDFITLFHKFVYLLSLVKKILTMFVR